MYNKINISSLFVICICYAFSILSFGHGVLFEIVHKEDNKVNIYLKWANSDDSRGLFPLYYQLEKAKVVTIGYEVKDAPNPNQFLEFDLRKSIPPIRVILRDIDPTARPLFSDINQTYASDYIRNLHDSGIVNGMPDGTFRPYQELTRAEFMIMVCKILKIEQIKEEGESKFQDIKDHWAKGSMLAGFEKGLIKGYWDNTLKPNKIISIAETCVIIDKSFNFATLREGYYRKLQRGKWFSNSVKRMFDAGIICVDDPIYRDFNEDMSLNRADISMMLSRAMTTMLKPILVDNNIK